MGGGAISDAPNFVLSNSDSGPCYNPADYGSGGGRWCLAANFTIAAQNGRPDDTTALIDNVTFHDYMKSTAGSHGECFFPLDVKTLTVQNSRFYNCHEAGIQMEFMTTPQSILIQNNWFGLTADTGGAGDNRCGAIRFSANAPWGPTLIRYNSFAHGQTVLKSSGGTDGVVSVVGNLLGVNPNGSCAEQTPAAISNFSYDSNIWEGADYGSHSSHVANIGSLYVNPAIDGAGDYHLAGAPGSTPADSYVTLTTSNASLSTDREGNPRAAPRDAGADER
jgi:hypothetical protein